MKKFLAIALTALMLVASATVFASAAEPTVFNDFESQTTLAEGVEVINQPAITADQYKDYYASSYDGAVMDNKATLSIADGKGLDGSKALSISMPKQTGNSNIGVELFTAEPMSIAGNSYLVVWADFSGVDFRKACFGVIGDNHIVYRTDERDSVSDLKFYIQDGNGAWTEKLHGGDGCFGAAQDSSVMDYKGWMAFPISDFVSYDDKDLAFDPATQKVTGVYFYFDYNNETYSEKPFYFDNIEFLADYTTADDVAAEESTDASVAESVAESTETPVETGDNTVAIALVAVIALAGSVVAVKKSR